LRFLIDAQLPPRLAHRLNELGHEAVHVFDLGLAAATDGQIWEEAIARDAAVVTKDRDFSTWRVARLEGPAIVWLRFGNCDTDTLIKRMIGALDQIAAAIGRGEEVVEVVAE
jgi:predicted nuclease of predicted toxin-antitoxin system